MSPIILKRQMTDGSWLSAAFVPQCGMNLQSLKKGDVEVIDQATRSLFEERFAGLGSLIGPHFHHRDPSQIPDISVESLFPFVKKLKEKGVLEPFSHGIARYVPWQYESTPLSLKGKLQGSDLYKGVSLSSLEGFDFSMEFQAELLSDGLLLNVSVESEKPSLVGLHYYYALPKSGGKVFSSIEKTVRTAKGWEEISPSWMNKNGSLEFDALQEADFGFVPISTGEGFEILYENKDYSLKITFQTKSSDVSWQLYRPKEASYICLEPLSTKNPKNPSDLKSSLQVKIEILKSSFDV